MTAFAELDLVARTEELKDAVRQIRVIGDEGEHTEQRVKKSTDGMGASFKALKAVMVPVIAAMGAMFAGGAIIREIGDFETAMSGVGAVTRATSSDLEAMRKTALELGRTTEFSAAQAADGLKYLGMAGFTASEAVAALPSTLDLATGASLGLSQAADIASNVISGFGMSAQDASEVADVLAAAASRANTDVAQLGGAMSTVAPISASLGISLQDTAAAIGVLSNAGIQGERAGTALRGVLAALASPTDQAADALKKYGVSVDQVNPATHSLAQIMGTLHNAGMDAGDAMTVFGREAASGALALAGASDQIGTLADQLRNAQGAASDMAGVMRDNLQGDIASLQSALSGLMLAIGEAGLTDALRGLTQGLTEVFQFMGENVQPAFDSLIVVLTALAGTQLPALVTSLAAATSGMSLMTVATTALTAATTALSTAMTFLGGPIGIAIGLIAGAGVLAYQAIARESDRAKSKLDEVADSFNVAGNNALSASGSVSSVSTNLSTFSGQQGTVVSAADAMAGGFDRLATKADNAATNIQKSIDKWREANKVGMVDYSGSAAGIQDYLDNPGGSGQSLGMTTGKPIYEQGLYGSSLGLDLLPPDPKKGRSGRGGGGSGSAGGFDTRLERIQDQLMSERELTDKWYEESKQILEDRRAEEILGTEAQKEALLELEQKYHQKLADLQQKASANEIAVRKATVNAAVGLLQQLGQKSEALAKVAVAVNAAQRIMEIRANTAAAIMRAYAELGPIAGSAAAARIATMGAIQQAIAAASATLQIAGGSGGGGGGKISTGSATGSSSREPTVTPTQRERYVRIEVNGEGMFADMLRNSVDEIADALFDESKTGGTTIVVGR